MDMRLGKTLVTIRRCELYIPRNPDAGLRVLVVAPNSALGSWWDELEAEGYADRTVFLQASTKKKRQELLTEGNMWCLLNKEGHRAIPEIAKIAWDVVILDESTFISNAKAAVTKFYLRNFRSVPHRWILTGRPNPESDMQLWCQMAFLHSGWLGCKTFWQFRTRMFEKRWTAYDWEPKERTATEIKRQLSEQCFILRRADVNLDVPKIRTTRYLDMPRDLRRIYNKAEEDFALEIRRGAGTKTKLTKLATQKWLWLRQMASGMVDGRIVWPGKINELLYLLDTELKEQPLVVFFSYNKELAAVDESLTTAGITSRFITGAIKPRERRSIVKNFRRKAFQVLLMQVAVGQTGLDLSRSDTAVYYSAPPGGEARMQSEDRLIHPTKAGKGKSVLIIDLATRDSVDIDLLESLKHKEHSSTWTMKRVVRMMQKRLKKVAA